MKIIEFKKYDNVKNKKELNKKKVAITSVIFILLIIMLIVALIYMSNRDFRNFMDTYILGKTITSESLNSIDITTKENINVYAVDKYVVTLEKNNLNFYTSSGQIENQVQINISNPVFESNEKYLLIAEKEKSKAYLLHGTKIVWEKDIEGEISRISVNKNGYVAIVISGTTYKSVIITYDKTGKELFKTYLSNTIVGDCQISKDNKLLGFVEINTNGALIESKVKVVDIQKAITIPKESILHTYEIETNELVVDLRYQEKNKLVCITDSGIYVLADGESKQIVTFNNIMKKITFCGINLNNNIYIIEEIAYGILNQALNIEIVNSANQKQNLYTINGVAKQSYSYGDVIMINLGNEVHFINTRGWLIKKYISSQEVRDVVMSNDIAGLIYNNKIEILSL